VGLFLGLGWEDHSVNIELCKIDGHSHLSVTNAGEAPLGFHSTSFPMSEELPHGYITNLYAVESNEKLRVLLEQLLLLLETPRKNLKEDPASLFYELLNQCPMLASQDSPRPLQQGPHCVTYNLQEGIACALRRNGAYELANRFLLFIKEQAAQAPNCAAQQELLNELVGS
jgi:hypothetical protein